MGDVQRHNNYFSRDRINSDRFNSINYDYVSRNRKGRVIKTETYIRDEHGNVIHSVSESERSIYRQNPIAGLTEFQSNALVFCGVAAVSGVLMAIGVWVLGSTLDAAGRTLNNWMQSEVEDIYHA